MPHQCTNCGRTFEDGSKEMLSGCPDCSGSTFQFRPDGEDLADEPPEEPPEPPERPGGAVSRTVGKTAATVRDVVSNGPSVGSTTTPENSGPTRDDPDDDIIVAEEDTAQASARADVVRPDELPEDPPGEGDHRFQPTATAETDEEVVEETTEANDASESDASRPDLKELREELNDQFESIKVLSPGQYELNLMELYDREEYIIALEEDGRYSIQVPERFNE